ncbi:hypothetical protein D3C72_1442230 [compost metagenome]
MLESPSMRAVQLLPGTSVIPASRPSRCRLRSKTDPSFAIAIKAAPIRTGFSAFGALTGNSSGSRVASASQLSLTGQIAQAGRRGVQIVAPISIMACAKSPGLSAGVISPMRARISVLAAGRGVSIANNREITRSTLPSTTAAGSPKAIAAMAAEV